MVAGANGAHRLHVVVNDELVLDAGSWEEVCEPFPQRLIHPPTPTMFEQVLAYLEQVADSRPTGYVGIKLAEEAIAATAACVRWGSYLAVLLDHDKPVSSETRHPEVSRVSNGEMARINIEASAALARWIDILRDDWDRYEALVQASWRLPMPQKKVSRDRDYLHLLALSRPEFTTALNLPRQGEVYERVHTHPTRTLANALINACWRNGPIEDIHGGQLGTYPLSQRRVTAREEQELMRTTASRMIYGLYAFTCPSEPEDQRSWVERVLPYAYAGELLVTPARWSMVETSREVILPGREPSTP